MRDMADKGRREIHNPEKRRGTRGSDERGFVLLIVMILIAALLLLGLAANRSMFTDVGIASNHGRNTSAFYAAEAQGELCFNQLLAYLPANQTTTVFATNLPNPGAANIGNGTYAFAPANQAAYIVPVGTPVQRPAPAPYSGLTSWVQTYRIAAAATDNNTGVTNSVAMEVQSQLIPVFQFLIFYNADLELNPGAIMNIGTAAQKGWIHTNGNMFTSPGATETIYSSLSVTGDLVHSRKLGDTQADGTGIVNIENASSGFNQLPATASASYNSNNQLVSNTNWTQTVNGNPPIEPQWNNLSATPPVYNVETGAPSVTLPTGVSGNPENILNQSGAGTMGSKAALTIINGVAQDAAGNTHSTCYSNPNYKSGGNLKIDSGCNAGANQQSVTIGSQNGNNNTVYDYREVMTAQTTDINVAGLQASAAGTALATAANGGDAGVLWVNSTANTTQGSTFNAVRLTDSDPTDGQARIANTGVWTSNGTPTGLTVATPMPMYVEGNYNTANATNGYPPPAALMSDALTVLSSSWSSTNYTKSNDTSVSDRPATTTTINVDIMTGNRDTTVQSGGSQGYGGGVNNLTRFLENWTNQTFNFGGSLVCLWQSSKVTGKYQNPGNYYNVPNRNFTFNPFNSEMPPGTPYFPIVSKGTWRHF